MEEFVASLLAKIELDHQCENLELSLLETKCKDVAETELSIMDSKHDKSECGIDVFNICHAQIDASPLVEESSLEVIEPLIDSLNHDFIENSKIETTNTDTNDISIDIEKLVGDQSNKIECLNILEHSPEFEKLTDFTKEVVTKIFP